MARQIDLDATCQDRVQDIDNQRRGVVPATRSEGTFDQPLGRFLGIPTTDNLGKLLGRSHIPDAICAQNEAVACFDINSSLVGIACGLPATNAPSQQTLAFFDRVIGR
jgi:hypothetical protein